VNTNAYALLGLTAIVGVVAATLMFSLLRFVSAAKDHRQRSAGSGENAFLAAALQEALAKLKVQERATAARADASERLSG